MGDGSPKNPGTADNRGPLTPEELEDLFVTHLYQARRDEDALEKAMEAVRAVRKLRTRNRAACRTDGFPLSELDNILKDETMALSDVEEREAKRLVMRRVANLPGGKGEQLSLFDDSFEEQERADKRWRDHGYNKGRLGLDQDPAKYEVPSDQVQNWMAGYGEGQERLGRAWATKSKLENVPIPDDVPKWTPPEEAAAEAPAPEPEPA